MGFTTTFNYCVNAAAGDCMNAATGTGFVTVTDPDGNTTVDNYTQGALAAADRLDRRRTPDLRAGLRPRPRPRAAAGGGTCSTPPAPTATATSPATTYDAAGNRRRSTAPDRRRHQTATTTGSLHQPGAGQLRRGPPQATRPARPTQPARRRSRPAARSPRRPRPRRRASRYTLYDTDGNELYTTTGVYEPGSTHRRLLADHLPAVQGQQRHPERHDTSPARPTPPSPSLPCATINADGVVTQLAYDSARAT